MELSRTETPDCVASSPINLKMVSSLPLVIVLACFSLLGHLHSRVFVRALQFWPASSDDTVPFSDAFQHDFHKFHISNKLTYHILCKVPEKENCDEYDILSDGCIPDCILLHF